MLQHTWILEKLTLKKISKAMELKFSGMIDLLQSVSNQSTVEL